MTWDDQTETDHVAVSGMVYASRPIACRATDQRIIESYDHHVLVQRELGLDQLQRDGRRYFHCFLNWTGASVSQ